MKKSLKLFIGMLVLFSSPLISVGILHLSRNIITPNALFFELQIGEIPLIDEDNWTLMVTGHVQNELIFDYDNFTNLNSKSVIATLECVEGPSGTAKWLGIPLRDVLEMAIINESGYDIVFHAADNYSDSLSLDQALADNILLAYKMNGENLPPEHGFPVRLVAPDHYGYKWVKWIIKIEVVDYDYIGFWEQRGWSDLAMRTNFTSWINHAYLFSITFFFAGLSIASGYKYEPRSTLFKNLPDFITIRFHILFSILFVVSSFITFLYWSISTILLRADLFYSLHGIIGLATMIFISIGSIFGIPKIIKSKKRADLHYKTSKIAFYMYLFSILFGFSIALIGGIRLFQTIR